MKFGRGFKSPPFGGIMADTTFANIYPPLKAIDLGDGTYALAIYSINPTPGVDRVMKGIIPPVKAVDNNDGTFLLRMEAV